MNSYLDSECPFCGATEPMDMLEVWPDERAFLPDFCCEEYQDWWLAQAGEMRPTAWRELLRDTAGIECKRVVETDDGLSYAIDYGLTIGPIDFATARNFIEQHHSHNPQLTGWRFGFGCFNGDELVAVATVGRPGARMLPQFTWVEISRVCVKGMRASKLKGFACSKLYAACEREAEARGYEKIITYTRIDEEATALTETGWNREKKTRAEGWDRKSRRRVQKSEVIRKWRWGKRLNEPTVLELTA